MQSLSVSAQSYTNYKLRCHSQPLCFTTTLKQFSQQDTKTLQRPSHHLSGSCEQTSAPGQDLLKREPGQESLRGDPKGGGGVGWLTQPGQNVLLAGPDTQRRNAFK